MDESASSDHSPIPSTYRNAQHTPYKPTRTPIPLDDPFFDEGNIELKAVWLSCNSDVKANVNIWEVVNEIGREERPHITCSLTPCNSVSFPSVETYEAHYETLHRYLCSKCKRVLPNARLLNLHILENHDSFFQVMTEKQKMFECFVENCTRKFASAKTRRRHLIEKHQFPASFKFSVAGIPTIHSSNNPREDCHRSSAGGADIDVDKPSTPAAKTKQGGQPKKKKWNRRVQPFHRPKTSDMQSLNTPLDALGLSNHELEEMQTSRNAFSSNNQTTKISGTNDKDVQEEIDMDVDVLTSRLSNVSIRAPPVIRFGNAKRSFYQPKKS